MIPTDAADRIEAMLTEANDAERAAKLARDTARAYDLYYQMHQLRSDAARFPIPCDGE